MNLFDKPSSMKALSGAFILALTFWLVIKLSHSYEHTVEIPLQVTINNPEIVLKYPAPDSVQVSLYGRGIDLLRLNFYDASYTVDLSDESESFDLNLNDNKEYVKLPSQVKASVRSIMRPHEFRFELDRRSTRKIPVQVNAEVSTANGFILTSITTSPDSISLMGPAGFVDTVGIFRTEALRFKDLDQSEQALVKLRPVTKVFFCEFQKEVTVNLDVQRLTEKTFENVTVQLRNIPPGLDAVSLPPTTNIYVKGGDKILAECVPEDFTVYIDLAKVWKPGNKEKVPAVVETSANVLTAEPDPARFELVVKKKEKTQ